jgi:hypothetical protein
MTATHATVRHLTGRVEGLGLYLWTISLYHQDFLINWTDIKQVHMGQYGLTEKNAP